MPRFRLDWRRPGCYAHGVMATARHMVVVGIVVVLGCGGSGKPPPSSPVPPPDKVVDEPALQGPGIRLVVSPGDAEVVVDGERVGLASEMEAGFIKLESGLHQIVVQKDGHETWRAEVTVSEEVERIEVNLEPDGS
jgi:hypothetical protein